MSNMNQRAERRAAPKPARIPSGDRPTYPSDEGRHHFLPLTWLSNSMKVGRSPEYRTLRPNSTATCGA